MHERFVCLACAGVVAPQSQRVSQFHAAATDAIDHALSISLSRSLSLFIEKRTWITRCNVRTFNATVGLVLVADEYNNETNIGRFPRTHTARFWIKRQRASHC